MMRTTRAVLLAVIVFVFLTLVLAYSVRAVPFVTTTTWDLPYRLEINGRGLDPFDTLVVAGIHHVTLEVSGDYLEEFDLIDLLSVSVLAGTGTLKTLGAPLLPDTPVMRGAEELGTISFGALVVDASVLPLIRTNTTRTMTAFKARLFANTSVNGAVLRVSGVIEPKARWACDAGGCELEALPRPRRLHIKGASVSTLNLLGRAETGTESLQVVGLTLIPEPGTGALFSLGLVGLALFGRRR